MTKQEQIEAMAKEFEDINVYQDNECCKCKKYEYNECEDECFTKKSAEYFYNLGYRIVPDDAVVLTKVEYESLRQSLTQTTNRECELADRARALLHECDVLKVDLEKARKETAKEILNRINEYNLDYNWDLKEEFKKLCKDYDVEVEE